MDETRRRRDGYWLMTTPASLTAAEDIRKGEWAGIYPQPGAPLLNPAYLWRCPDDCESAVPVLDDLHRGDPADLVAGDGDWGIMRADGPRRDVPHDISRWRQMGSSRFQADRRYEAGERVADKLGEDSDIPPDGPQPLVPALPEHDEDGERGRAVFEVAEPIEAGQPLEYVFDNVREVFGLRPWREWG